MAAVDDGYYARTNAQLAAAQAAQAAAAAAAKAAADAAAAKTRQQRMDELQAEREAKYAADAKARAATNPTYNPTQRPDAPPADANYIYYYSWIGGATTGEWKLYRAVNTDANMGSYGARAVGGTTQSDGSRASGANALQTQPQPIKDANGRIIGYTQPGGKTTGGGSTGGGSTGGGSTGGGSTGGGSTGGGSTGGGSTGGGSTGGGFTGGGNQGGGSTGVDMAAAENVMSIIIDRLKRYNLESLAPLIRKLAIEGASEATIMLRLQEEPLYQERFKANQARIAKGLKVLTPSEYINIEDDYRQVLRAYGLNAFDNDAYVSQFLANDVSVNELSNRVVAAVQRVKNADPAVQSMLRGYYGISNGDLVAYVLDPNQAFPKIERQIAASEIGVAAARQGFNIGVPTAEQLAAQGITQAEAQRGYATIADILPTATKLSDIYGNVLEGYGLAEGEQEVFNQLASAQRKRVALSQREIASFQGSSGMSRVSLQSGETKGQF